MISPEFAQKLHELAPLLTLAPALLAFSKKSRQEIGDRDNWTCSHPNCNRGKHNGYNIQASHHNHNKNAPDYDNPSNGEILCIEHHALDELLRGNLWGANAILSNGLYNKWGERMEGGNIYLTHEEVLRNHEKNIPPKKPWNPLED